MMSRFAAALDPEAEFMKRHPIIGVGIRMDNLMSDVRYAFRAFVRNPAFTLVATMSLALGIGVNVVIFSVANAVLEKPIAGAADPDRLVRVYRGSHSPLSYTDYLYFRSGVRSFAGVVAERTQVVTTARDGVVAPLQAAIVSDDYFSILGVKAAVGRLFSAGSETGGVVVLGHRYWTRELGADPAVVGSTVRLNDSPFVVVGVASPEFTSSVALWSPQVFVPFSAARPVFGTDVAAWDGSVYSTARLATSVDRTSAQSEVDVRTSQLVASSRGTRDGMTVRLDRARGVVAEIRAPAAVVSAFLMALVGLVLLIACGNVANLLLARASSRRREIGIRLATGASRSRIVRQLLTESLMLAGLGAVVAFVIAVQAARLLAGVLVAAAPIDLTVSFAPDARVVAFTALTALVTAVLFGLAPALQATRRDLVGALRDDGDRAGYRRSRLRSGLVIGQVLLCTVLVAGSTLFLRSLGNAKTIDPGFTTAGIIDVPIDLGPRRLDEAAGTVFFERVLDESRRIPGVQSATLANVVPLSGSNNESTIWIEGTPAAPGQRQPRAYFNVVSTRYLETLRIPVIRGREVMAPDTREANPVVVVNETMARRLWPDRDALGMRISTSGPTGPWLTVVGVARDTRYNSLGEATPSFMYLPLAQTYQPSMVLQIRTDVSLQTVSSVVGRVVKSLDPQLPAVRPSTLAADMQLALLPAKLGAALLGTFGGLALLLATVGIYGVASFAVAQRTREIGIRTALGAQRSDVLRLVVGESARRIAIGLVVGLAGAFGLSRVIASQLYGVAVVDPVTFAVTPAILGAAGLLASWFPARRAARVDPLVALRGD
jgi:predicted permease